MTDVQYLSRAKERFLDKVQPEPNTGCWLWIGWENGQGYGRFWFRDRPHPAHRVAYILFTGSIPKGIYVCHSCDVGICVNPAHLWLGSQADNLADAVDKGRVFRPYGNGYARGKTR